MTKPSKRDVQAAAAVAEPRKPSDDLVTEALEFSAGRQRREAADDEVWHSDVRAIYATLLARSNEPRENDAFELANCIEALKLSEHDIRRDQAALDSFREQTKRRDRVDEAREALEQAVADRKAVEARHKQESRHAELKVFRRRSEMYEAGAASSEMQNLRLRFPHLVAAFDSIKAAADF